MARGFECYFLMRDSAVSLETKIDILVNSYKDIVLFFNIDANDPKPGLTWLQFIKSISKKYEGRILIGIMYSKRPSKYEADNIGFLYENEARANCGSYMLDYDKRKNFATMLQALVNVGAQGRRKNVRILCTSNCKMRFQYLSGEFFINLTDLSLSHFTGTFDVGSLKLNVNEKINGIEFNVKGTHFSHDATLLIRRPIDDKKEICVFAFTNKNGQAGLEATVHDMLIPKLYLLLTENFNKTFMKLYEERLQQDTAR